MSLALNPKVAEVAGSDAGGVSSRFTLGAWVSTVHVQTAASGSRFSFSEVSIATTSKVCVPGSRPVNVIPEMQVVSRPSRKHSKVEGSLAENWKVAVVAEVGLFGPRVIVVFGGLRSAISHSNWVGSRLTCPARLVAWTSNVHSSIARFS